MASLGFSLSALAAPGAALLLSTAWGAGGHGAQAQLSPPRIPLKPGLTIVTALNEPDKGDYESIKVIVEANSQVVRLKYSGEYTAAGSDDSPLAAVLGGRQRQTANRQDAATARRVRATRTVSRQDLESAIDYRWRYGDNAPEAYPGSTAVGVSRRVLNDLKAKGETPLRVPAGGMEDTLGSLLGSLLGGSSPELDAASMASGTLERVSATPVAFKVIVNDDAVELPAVHARGRLGEDDAEFWILDDADNPLALRWEVGGRRLQVIRLAFPTDPAGTPATGKPMPGGPPTAAVGSGVGGAKRIEEDLARQGRAVVYGIYFDFASDHIKEESEPVLAEIAQVLRENPTWNLNVEGHTDSIGGDAYNQGLSERRSASVRRALVTRYEIDAHRLKTSGFGASRPKDRNDTMEGRARNRRVELVKAS